jgi:hypothetical protein
MIRVACPACFSLFDTDERNAGRSFRCSKCSQQVRVPDPQVAREGVLMPRGIGPSWPVSSRSRPGMPLFALMLGAPALAICLSLLIHSALSFVETLCETRHDPDLNWTKPESRPAAVPARHQVEPKKKR